MSERSEFSLRPEGADRESTEAHAGLPRSRESPTVPCPSRPYDPVKRTMDVTVSAAGLLLLFPVLLLAAAAVKLTSPGPALYRARRAGRRGQPFDMLKLRTMRAGADRDGPITPGSDPRVTPVGRFLRATRLDEAPQLWNVLRGEMSLVGPRPEDLSIVERHFTPEQRQVLVARPGMTCTGNLYHVLYQEHLDPPPGTSAEEFYVSCLLDPKIAADLHYVRHRSLGYDLRLLWQTFRILASRTLGRQPRWTPPIGIEPVR